VAIDGRVLHLRDAAASPTWPLSGRALRTVRYSSADLRGLAGPSAGPVL
jgi:hypothetical protein